MTHEELKTIRGNLKMTQHQLSQLLGVHPITVSKWERGRIPVPPYHGTLMKSFAEAYKKHPDVGKRAITVLMWGGIGPALYCLFRAAYERKE